MQKWEYAVVEKVSIKPRNDFVPAYAVNRQVFEPHTTNIEKVANELGEHGWELVAAYPINAGKSASFIFKRPKNLATQLKNTTL
jgi:hypothetical protein